MLKKQAQQRKELFERQQKMIAARKAEEKKEKVREGEGPGQQTEANNDEQEAG